MARYKQTYDNSCGAVALMCAASELGVTRLPKFGKWQAIVDPSPRQKTADMINALKAWDDTEFQGGIVNGGKTVETALYAITSGDLISYSMPSRVITCAKLLGLECTLHMAPNFYTKVLKWTYGKEEERCKNAGCKMISGEPPDTQTNQRSLIVFTTWGIGLHYVMRRPDTAQQYMDPGDGTNYTNFQALNENWKKKYSDTLIHIVLENQKN